MQLFAGETIMKYILKIYDKLAVLEQQLTAMINYHESNGQNTFFKDYDKLDKLKEIRFSIRQLTQLIENQLVFSPENIAKIENSLPNNNY